MAEIKPNSLFDLPMRNSLLLVKICVRWMMIVRNIEIEDIDLEKAIIRFYRTLSNSLSRDSREKKKQSFVRSTSLII